MKKKDEYYKIQNFVEAACKKYVRENHPEIYLAIQKAADDKFPGVRGDFRISNSFDEMVTIK